MQKESEDDGGASESKEAQKTMRMRSLASLEELRIDLRPVSWRRSIVASFETAGMVDDAVLAKQHLGDG